VGRIRKIHAAIFLVGFLAVIGFSSCRTAREIPTAKEAIKPMNAAKLIRNIENNTFDYKHLSVKKIACQFEDGKSRTSFRASIQAENKKQIFVMLTKLNIPVARLWLTPDSVKMINYLENTFLLDDYSYLSSMLGFDISFQTVNAIISNDIFAFQAEKREKDNRDYETSVDSGMYLLQSEKMLKIGSSDKSRSANSRKIRSGSSTIRQRVYVDPVTFKARKINVEDKGNSRSLNLDFSGFTEVEKELYPADILLQFKSPENQMKLSINMSNFSTKEEKPVRFRIPEKYTQIGHE
jgi:hypothetical protein